MDYSQLFSVENVLTLTASLNLVYVIGGAIGLGFLKLVGLFIPERNHG